MRPLAHTIRVMHVPAHNLAVFWLGGAAFAFKTPSGKIIYIDPYLSDSLDHYYSWKRLPLSPILVEPEEATADAFLITHAHEDHLDPETLPTLAEKTKAVFAGPSMCIDKMKEWKFDPKRLIKMDRGETSQIAGFKVTSVFADHVSPVGTQCPDAVGYVIDFDGIVVYHTGDTLFHESLKDARRFSPNLMLPCINAGYGNMNQDEAAEVVKAVDPIVTIPMHWGLVAENTSDPLVFTAALAAKGCQTRPLLLTPGDYVVSSFRRHTV